jgi:hypothetical protein
MARKLHVEYKGVESDGTILRGMSILGIQMTPRCNVMVRVNNALLPTFAADKANA